MFLEIFKTYGPYVFGGALFLAASWIFARWAGWLLAKGLANNEILDAGTVKVLAYIVRYSIIVLAAIAVLEELGVEVASLIAALGIFGFAIAIGLRTTTTNFFTGIMLYVLKPYEVGDYIDGERVEGVVESMSLFHTVVITEDGEYVAVPNTAMWTRSVTNFSRRRPRAIKLDVSIKKGRPVSNIEAAILQTLKADPEVFKGFDPLVQIGIVRADTMKLELTFWCAAEEARDVRLRVTAALKESLKDAGAPVTKIALAKNKAPKKQPDRSPPPVVDDVG